MAFAYDYVTDPERVRLALSPIRRRLLERLREPASATRLAAELGLSRQRVNYHLRALESAGLLDLVEERQRRGCTERILAARAGAFVVDPAVLGLPAEVGAQDRYAAEHLVGTAAGVVRDVARMEAAANHAGQRLLTFTIEAEVRLPEPADLERLAERLAAVLEEAAAEHPAGRPYRIVLGAHPSPGDSA